MKVEVDKTAAIA